VGIHVYMYIHVGTQKIFRCLCVVLAPRGKPRPTSPPEIRAPSFMVFICEFLFVFCVCVCDILCVCVRVCFVLAPRGKPRPTSPPERRAPSLMVFICEFLFVFCVCVRYFMCVCVSCSHLVVNPAVTDIQFIGVMFSLCFVCAWCVCERETDSVCVCFVLAPRGMPTQASPPELRAPSFNGVHLRVCSICVFCVCVCV